MTEKEMYALYEKKEDELRKYAVALSDYCNHMKCKKCTFYKKKYDVCILKKKPRTWLYNLP